ncbi:MULTISPECIES: hypothetical protein [unclassified Haloferax]|jgi:hypothetical protein|uniref:hypothetical protein n=1 Tax=unclassified Haloferax TaxID=2625095 RepID=UPI00287440E8|nr:MULTISPECIES: hypothetical protein [unclassified Haloferax]MDS0243072.1 hypothetical protein [Haloferax sp. S2CR25]MDS0446193.1 hypothetical protein [Haloferax sp. S2CR25-2]
MERQIIANRNDRAAFIKQLRALPEGSAVRIRGPTEDEEAYADGPFNATFVGRGQLTLRDQDGEILFIHLPVECAQDWWPFLTHSEYRTSTNNLCEVEELDILTTNRAEAFATVENGTRVSGGV